MIYIIVLTKQNADGNKNLIRNKFLGLSMWKNIIKCPT